MRLTRGLRATALGCAAATSLLGCADDAAPLPSVTLTSDATTVALGQRVTLTWTTRNARGCSAEGAWSGSKAADGSESVAVPLTQEQSNFGLVCTSGTRMARAEIVVTIRPPRFSVQALPLSVAIDLNDVGDVLGHDQYNAGGVPDYERYEDDPAVWTTTGVLRIATPCPKSCPPNLDLCRAGCPPGYSMTLLALNNHRTVLVREHLGPGIGTSRLIALGGQPLPAGGLPIDQPRALNDAVQIVGCCYMGTQFGMPPPFNKALLFSAGQLAVVQPPGSSGMAMVINESGVVAGHYAIAAEGPVHLFRHENGVSTDLGTSAAGGFPVPRGLNATGTIVGELALPAGSARESLAFRVRGGSSVLEALPDLGGEQGTATGVNDLEQVVGSSTLPGAPDTWRATLLSAGTLHRLDDLVVAPQGVSLKYGIDVNNAGQVLAVGCDAMGENCRPYLLTPVEAL